MPPETLDNGVREEVFGVLLDASGPLSPSEVSEEIGVDRELASYHLKILFNAGLVIREGDGKYFPQPLLTDPEFEGRVEEAIQELVAEAEESVYVSPGADVAPDAAVINAVRTSVTLYLFSGEGETSDSR